MKIKQIATAISAVLLSSSAFALSPTTAHDIEIFMSGATAQDKAMAALFKNICVNFDPTATSPVPVVDADGNRVPFDLDVFKDNANTSKPGKGHTAYFCTLDNAVVDAAVDPVAVGALATAYPKVLFHKRSKGGSAQGVNPVIDEVAINAMNIRNTNCDAPGTGAGANPAETFYRCNITEFEADGVTRTGNLNLVVSDAGVSDVNPEMFVGVNTPANNAAVNADDVSTKMVVTPAAALVFGVPVTTTLRNALQEAEIASGELDAACVGVETEACMPSLTKRQVATIISGKVQNWSSFKVNVGGVGTALTAIASTLPTSTKVTYCRRVNGSGTQAQMNAKFLHYPCTAGALKPAFEPGNPGIGPVVRENSGSGDMTVCLNDFNNGTNLSGENSDPTAGGAAVTAWALGVQSTEKNANLADDFRFIKIDGIAPTLENAANGKYHDWVEQTFQWRVPAYNGPTGDSMVILNAIAATASDPVVIATVLNPKFNHTWGQAGYMAVSTNFAPAADGILNLGGPVIPYTHAPKGKLDNCVVPVVNDLYKNSQL